MHESVSGFFIKKNSYLCKIVIKPMKTQKNFSIISWTLLTTSGFILGILLILVLALNIVGLNPYLQSPKGFSMSLCIGFMQWLLLRKHIDNSFKWVWFSIVGITSVFILFDIIIPIFKLNIQPVVRLAI